MLAFRLRLHDLATPGWHWMADQWANGESWIKPLANPVLEHRLVQDGLGRMCLVVWQRCGEPSRQAVPVPERVPTIEPLIAQTRLRQGDYVVIEVYPGRARISAGPTGTAPLYLTNASGSLAGTWHLPDLRHHISADRLLGRAVARALTRQPRYSTDTLFTNIQQLTERATAEFTRTGLTISYPLPALHVLKARRLRPGADAIAALHELLTIAITQVPAPPDRVGIELSGGADSANVALALAATRDDTIHSYGLVLAGDLGEQQRHRRALLVRKLGLRDTEIPAADHLPFTPAGRHRREPTAAYYREAFDAMCGAAQDHNTAVMVTGLGGDEINAPHSDEPALPHPAPAPVPWLGPAAKAALLDIEANLAPPAPVPLATLTAFALHNPTYLNAGIWPIAPLAHPPVIRFAEQLPARLRRGKHLFRQRLTRAAFPIEVADPQQPENFSGLMQAGLRRYGLALLKTMLADSILVDTGYLNPHALAETYQRALVSGTIPANLADPIAIEVGLRNLG